MADSRYCRMCHGPCDNCVPCMLKPDRFNPTPDMIKTALEKKGAFTSSTFRTISSDPPKISVTNRADGGSQVDVRLTSMSFTSAYRDPGSPERRELEKAAREEIIRSFDLPRHRFKSLRDRMKTALEKKGAFASSAFQTISKDLPNISVSTSLNGNTDVAVRLTSMRFIPEYRDPESPERRQLEKAAREEIIRSFDLPRDRVGDGDIKVDIREGSVKILICMVGAIVSIATATINALNSAPRENVSAILLTFVRAIAAVSAGAAGAPFGPIGMGLGALAGLVGGSLF